METTRTGQEKLAAGLSVFLFFIPLLMSVRTPFVVKYMKQGFILNVASLALALLASILWVLTPFLGIANLAIFVVTVWLAIQAFTGKDYGIAFLTENAEKLISTLSVQSWFTSK